MNNYVTKKFYDNIEKITKMRLEEKKTIKDIAKMFGFNKGTLTNLLIKNNIILVPENKFTDEFKNEVVRLYVEEKMGMHKIGAKLHTEHQKVKEILIERNIQLRTPSEFAKQYNINEHYFDIIDTQDKAYILGFLYADGYNDEQHGRISISLQDRDKDILDKICLALDYDNQPKFSSFNHDKNPNWSKVYRLNISNKHISKILSQHGMMQNKSLKIVFPEHLDKSLHPHFLRGYFDGDGCFYYNNKTKWNDQINMVGTEQFCMRVLEILHDNNVILGGKVCKTGHGDNGSTRMIRFGGAKQTKMFLDWLYKDANLYLNRKHQKYIDRYYSNIDNTLSA